MTSTIYRPAFGTLGKGTVIVSPRILRGVERIHIGERVQIYAGAWLQCEDSGSLFIGDETYVGHDVHLHAVADIEIGPGCVIADGAFMATADHRRDDRHRVHPTGPTTIGSRVFVGQRAIILGGVTIGDGATVAAGAVVTKDVEAGAVVAGTPARVIPQPSA